MAESESGPLNVPVSEGLQPLPLASFGDFITVRVLSEDPRTKSVYILGRFKGKEGDAVVLVERQHLGLSVLPLLLSSPTKLALTLQNDVYGKYEARSSDPAVNVINATVIYPATEKHVLKYSAQEYVMVEESPELYCAVTLPYISSIPPNRIQWVYNILAKTAEADRLLFEDPDPLIGFTLHPDLKWDQSQLGNLYCVVICHRRDIKSLRDLRTEHLPLLNNIRSKAYAAIQERFGIEKEKLRSYIHYQPSYYHLHVHITHVAYEGGQGSSVGKAHLLEDVIDNLQIAGDEYYKHRTLYYSLGVNDPLWALLKAHNLCHHASPHLDAPTPP